MVTIKTPVKGRSKMDVREFSFLNPSDREEFLLRNIVKTLAAEALRDVIAEIDSIPYAKSNQTLIDIRRSAVNHLSLCN